MEEKVTAKSTLSRLNGYIIIEKGNAVVYSRQGNDVAVGKANSNIARLEYAKAAVEYFKLQGKSAVKALAALKEEQASAPSEAEQAEAEEYDPGF